MAAVRSLVQAGAAMAAAVLTPFQRGYGDYFKGISVCPYDSPYLQRLWLKGYAAARNKR